MKALSAFLVPVLGFVQFALMGSPLLAQAPGEGYGSIRTVTTQSWIEEWDPAQGRWVRVAEEEAAAPPETHALPTVVTTIVNGEVVADARQAARYAFPASPSRSAMALAHYGPFVVASPTRATMIGSTDSRSPQHFDAMLRDFPGIATLEMVEAPGTSNDIANLAVGRRIRAAGIATHVPRGGSVRSGAVELFLAGATRRIEDGAQFAVHSWLDNHGREADDFAADHAAHRLYIDYYIEMGMSEEQARAFYAMTNSVPHASARWLVADEMRQWVAPESPSRYAARRLVAADAGEVERLAILTRDVLAETERHVAATSWEQLVFAASAPAIRYGPTIHYSDVTLVNVARLDASLLDSGLAFP